VDANLTRADLTECSFDGARVINSTFSQSVLGNSTFRGTRFRGGDYHKVSPEMLKAMRIAPLCNPMASGEKLPMRPSNEVAQISAHRQCRASPVVHVTGDTRRQVPEAM
jgi:hypothetical protein